MLEAVIIIALSVSTANTIRGWWKEKERPSLTEPFVKGAKVITAAAKAAKVAIVEAKTVH